MLALSTEGSFWNGRLLRQPVYVRINRVAELDDDLDGGRTNENGGSRRQ